METVAAEIKRHSELRRRNTQGRMAWAYRRFMAEKTYSQPDLRNEEQQWLGIELEWHRRMVLHNVRARP